MINSYNKTNGEADADSEESQLADETDEWGRSLPGEEKKKYCRKGTQITVYDNGNLRVVTFRCHRWDCPFCERVNINQIMAKVMDKCSSWFVSFIEGDKYGAVKKRIERAKAKYCAVGTPDLWLMLVDKPVISETQALPDVVPKQINLVLERSEQYSYRQRRLRYSKGLFDSGQAQSIIHIIGSVLVKESRRVVLAKLEAHGYEIRSSFGGASYAQKEDVLPETILEELASSDMLNVASVKRNVPLKA